MYMHAEERLTQISPETDSGKVTVVFSSSSVRGPYGSAIDHVVKMFRAHLLLS